VKVFFRLLISFTIIIMFLSIVSCSSSKDLISMQQFQKLSKDNGIDIVNKGINDTQPFILQQKHSTIYYIDNDEKNLLYVFIFSSVKERKKAKLEYTEKTSMADIFFHNEIYEAKNIIVVIMAGDKSNIYYSKVASLMGKIEKQ
jgi:hypothetical protein